MSIGNFIFMSYVQIITMMRPNLPTVIQFGFFCFWLAIVWLGAVHDFLIIFIVMVFVGGL